MATRPKTEASSRPEEDAPSPKPAHTLDKGETVIASNGNIAVTSEGRKVILDGKTVVERLMGPPYAWEADE